MKLVLILAVVLGVFVVSCLTEMCKSDADCAADNVTACATGFSLKCEHHQCNCVDTNTGGHTAGQIPCLTSADCTSLAGKHCKHPDQNHCVDGHCECHVH